MTKINIREILERHEYLARVQTDSMPDLRQATINAIKEIVEATVDLCAEKAVCEEGAIVDLGNTIVDAAVDKQSILNVKNLVEYEYVIS